MENVPTLLVNFSIVNWQVFPLKDFLKEFRVVKLQGKLDWARVINPITSIRLHTMLV